MIPGPAIHPVFFSRSHNACSPAIILGLTSLASSSSPDTFPSSLNLVNSYSPFKASPRSPAPGKPPTQPRLQTLQPRPLLPGVTPSLSLPCYFIIILCLASPLNYLVYWGQRPSLLIAVCPPPPTHTQILLLCEITLLLCVLSVLSHFIGGFVEVEFEKALHFSPGVCNGQTKNVIWLESHGLATEVL